MANFYQDQDIKDVLNNLFDKGDWWKYTGELVQKFEKKFAQIHDSQYAVSVSNGTVALDIILKAIGLEDGDEVILPAYNFYSLPKNVLNLGGKPVFVDVVPDNFTIDANKIEDKITANTKAIIAVHISSSIAEMDKIKAIAKKHNLVLIEDCAQAHGGIYNNQKVGSWGDFGIFSFGGVKLMTSGQGGMITTSDENAYLKCFAICNRGLLPNKQMNHFGIIGENYQLSLLQVALLEPQLKKLERLCKQREQAARYLDSKIEQIQGVRPIYQFKQTKIRAQMRYAFLANETFQELIISKGKQLGLDILKGFSTVQNEARLQGLFSSKVKFPNADIGQKEILCLHHTFLLGNKEELDKLIYSITSALPQI